MTKRPLPVSRLRQRLDVASRSIAAIIGGYALAASAAAWLAVALPIARGQAVLAGMMTGILIAAGAALWAFSARSGLRAWLGIALPALLCWAGLRALGAGT